MKVFAGIIIIIASISVIAFAHWNYFVHMVAFGRGLPEATFYQRAIASALTSIPFVISIYLALRYLIFGGNGKKKPLLGGKWSYLQIAIAFVCVSLYWPSISGVLFGVYFEFTQKRPETACRKMETDAYSTMAALADYYTDPHHMALPSVEQLIEKNGLSLYYSVTMEGDPEEDILITVIDDSAECPKGKKLTAQFGGGGEMEWKD